MSSWREVAAAVLAQPVTSTPTTDTFGLPVDLAASLRRLKTLSPPRLIDRSAWKPVVDDALRVATEGWAASALSLGWSQHDLFGVGPRDNWEFSGLAVWLRGRSLVLLDEKRAIAADEQQRSSFERGGFGHGKAPSVTPVFLWEFGR